MTRTQLLQFIQDNITHIPQTRDVNTMNERYHYVIGQITLAYCLELISLQEHDKFVDECDEAVAIFEAKTCIMNSTEQ